jgi:hypothetical protein
VVHLHPCWKRTFFLFCFFFVERYLNSFLPAVTVAMGHPEGPGKEEKTPSERHQCSARQMRSSALGGGTRGGLHSSACSTAAEQLMAADGRAASLCPCCWDNAPPAVKLTCCRQQAALRGRWCNGRSVAIRLVAILRPAGRRSMSVAEQLVCAPHLLPQSSCCRQCTDACFQGFSFSCCEWDWFVFVFDDVDK